MTLKAASGLIKAVVRRYLVGIQESPKAPAVDRARVSDQMPLALCAVLRVGRWRGPTAAAEEYV